MGKPSFKQSAKRLAHKSVAIITALSLVFLQTPVSYALEQSDDDAPAQAQELVQDQAPEQDQALEQEQAPEQVPEEALEQAQDQVPEQALDQVSDLTEGQGDSDQESTVELSKQEATPETPDTPEAAGDGENGQVVPGMLAVGEVDNEAQEAAIADGEVAPNAEDEKAEEKEKADTKRVYDYADESVKVTATLEKADAIPDDAQLVVTPVTSESEQYNYDAYMEALNQSADAQDQDVYTSENTLLYDIAFLATDKDGNTVELQPEAGSVKVKFEFKANQLSEGLNASPDAIKVVHLPLTNDAMEAVGTTAQATDIAATDVIVEDVDARVKANDPEAEAKTIDETAVFDTDSLSVWAFTGDPSHQIIIPEPDAATFKDSEQYLIDGVFGELANFGLIGFTSIDQQQHIHSNLATNTWILNANGEIGRRQTNQLPEVFYIGSSIQNNIGSGIIDIFKEGSQVILGHDLGESGQINANPGDSTYSATIGGKNYDIHAGANQPAAVEKDGVYYSTIFRQEKADSHYIDLAAMQQKAEKLSSGFAERTASAISITDGSNDVALVERVSPEAIGTVNFTAAEIGQKQRLLVDETAVDGITHLLIINVDAAGTDTVKLPGLNMENSLQTYTGEVQTWTSGNVIFNVYDSSKPNKMYTGSIETTSSPIAGSILAPYATVTANGNVNGEIIADKIVIKEEFHRDSITFTNEIPSVGGLRVAKTLDGQSSVSRQFDFKLEGIDGAPMPVGSNDGVLIKQNEADGLVTFGFLNFGSTGDYRYRVSEVLPADAEDLGGNQAYSTSEGVIYDTHVYIIVVHAERSANGGIGIGGYSTFCPGPRPRRSRRRSEYKGIRP